MSTPLPVPPNVRSESRPAPMRIRLDSDVKNPQPDRRKKSDWRAQPVWRAGMELVVSYVPFYCEGWTAVIDVPGGYLSMSAHDARAELILAASSATPLSLGDRLHQFDVTAGEVLGYLVGRGMLDLTDELLRDVRVACGYEGDV
jgi:hypothetical protein